MMQGTMDCHGLSDRGKVREVNEDQFLIADLNKSMRVHQTSLGIEDQTRLFGGSQGKILLVADGMGGHAGGERASTLAVDAVTTYLLNNMRWFFRLHEDPQDDFLDDLKSALDQCQARVSAEAERTPERREMGTTVTMAYVVWPRLYVVHVGDSRCYLLRQSELKQITTDHTVAQQYAEAGAIEPEDVESSRWSDVLWNVVGGDSKDIAPEVHRAELQIGDALLLCTDGLNKHVPDGQIARSLDANTDAEGICRRLVEAANDAGGSDNVTIVVARFRERDEHPKALEAEASLDEVIARTDGGTEEATTVVDDAPHPEPARERPANTPGSMSLQTTNR
jgi:protein phosphatase